MTALEPPPNVYKERAQLRKRDALCALIEKNVQSSGLDLFLHAVEIVGLLETFHPSIWDQLAHDAGVNPPSDEVIELVKKRFRSRIDDRPRVPSAPAGNDNQERWGR